MCDPQIKHSQGFHSHLLTCAEKRRIWVAPRAQWLRLTEGAPCPEFQLSHREQLTTELAGGSTVQCKKLGLWGPVSGSVSGQSLNIVEPHFLFCKIKKNRISPDNLVLGFRILIYVRCVCLHVFAPRSSVSVFTNEGCLPTLQSMPTTNNKN